MTRIEIFQEPTLKKWFFHVISGNNVLIACSVKPYASKRNAIKTAVGLAGKPLKLVVIE